MLVPRNVSPAPRFTPHRVDFIDGTFIFDAEMHIVTLLTSEREIQEQQHLTEQEFSILALIFEQYPDYCPLGDLLASQSSRPLDQCQDEVQRALNEGYIESVIRPVRSLLSRVRVKLHPFGIDVRSIMETGYLLVSDRNGFKRNKGEVIS